MIQLSSPTFVTPPPCTVPVLNVQYSRIRLPSPISSSVGSPAYFLSCGSPPIELNAAMRLRAPIVVRPSMTTCDAMRVPATDAYVGTDDAVRPDLDVVGELGARVDQRGRMDADFETGHAARVTCPAR